VAGTANHAPPTAKAAFGGQSRLIAIFGDVSLSHDRQKPSHVQHMIGPMWAITACRFSSCRLKGASGGSLNTCRL
jgi:hypothetical protein